MYTYRTVLLNPKQEFRCALTGIYGIVNIKLLSLQRN